MSSSALCVVCFWRMLWILQACTASCNDSHMRIPSTLQEGPQQLLDVCDLTENGSRMRQNGSDRSLSRGRCFRQPINVISTTSWHSSGGRPGWVPALCLLCVFSWVWRSRRCRYEQLAAVRPLRTSVCSDVLTMLLLDERIWLLFKRHWPQTLTYWSVFFSFGLCIAFLGPTILDLRCQTQSTLQQITWVFVSQQFFVLVGSSVGGLFKKTWVWLVNTECFHEV